MARINALLGGVLPAAGWILDNDIKQLRFPTSRVYDTILVALRNVEMSAAVEIKSCFVHGHLNRSFDDKENLTHQVSYHRRFS